MLSVQDDVAGFFQDVRPLEGFVERCPVAKLPCPRKKTILYDCSASASVSAICLVPEANSTKTTGTFLASTILVVNGHDLVARQRGAIATRGWA